MDMRKITEGYTVSPQIAPEDMDEIAKAGFGVVVCNRPDHEVEPELGSDAMRAAAEAAGLGFVYNPVENGAMTMEMVEAQGRALDEATAPVFAYCRSGTRCSVVWALSRAGQEPTEEILAATRAAGYDLAGLAPQIEALAKG